MFGQIQYLEKAKPYKIRNRKTQNLLTAGISISLASEKKNVEQIWLLSEVKHQQFQIVFLKSGEVLSYSQVGNNGYVLKLQKGRQKDNQLWSVCRAQIIDKQNYFWIKPIKTTSLLMCSSEDGQFCRISSIDPSIQLSLWSFDEFKIEESILSNTTPLKSQRSEFVIDIPDASTTDGTYLIQWSYHGGGNQRWIIQKALNQSSPDVVEYVIRSFSSQQLITYTNPTKEGAKVFQSMYNGSIVQRWSIIKAQGDFYLLQCIANPYFYLSTTNTKEGGNIVLSMDIQKCKWIIPNLKLTF